MSESTPCNGAATNDNANTKLNTLIQTLIEQMGEMGADMDVLGSVFVFFLRVLPPAKVVSSLLLQKRKVSMPAFE